MAKAMTCFNCGQSLVTMTNRRIPKLLTCSSQCEADVKKGIARQKKRLDLLVPNCAGCSKAFNPKRINATCCSYACRQRVYRRRARVRMPQTATA
jgi:hypothetical protein